MKRVLLFVLTLFVLLTGCGALDEYSVDSSEQERTGETTFESHEAEADTGESVLPEWLAPYAELGELPKPIYISGDSAEFAIDTNIRFPECNILCVTREATGDNITVADSESDAVITLVQEIEKAKVITEEQAVNPDAHLLGYNFSIVLLTSDSDYIHVRLASFDDGRVNITIEEDENEQTIWVMSLKLVEEMRKLADYEGFDKDMIDNITQAVLVDKNGNRYPLSEEAISRMQAILNRMSETTGDYKCPFDIDIVFDTKDESIKAGYCHDSCGILAVQGSYYRLDESDAEWLSELVTDFVH